MSKSFPINLFKNSFFTKKKCLGWDLIVIGSLLFAIVISCEWQVVPPLCQETRHQKKRCHCKRESGSYFNSQLWGRLHECALRNYFL